MLATTTQCSKCHGRGYYHTAIGKWATEIHSCNCRPAEYWKLKSQRGLEVLEARIIEFERGQAVGKG